MWRIYLNLQEFPSRKESELKSTEFFHYSMQKAIGGAWHFIFNGSIPINCCRKLNAITSSTNASSRAFCYSSCLFRFSIRAYFLII